MLATQLAGRTVIRVAHDQHPAHPGRVLTLDGSRLRQPPAPFEAVTALPAAALQLGAARAAADRITDVLDTPDPVRVPDHPFPPPGRPVTISIRGGTVRYPGQATPAVQNIDLDLGPGRRVALVGPAGAGKSTLAAVLFRFVDLTSGTARLLAGPSLLVLDEPSAHLDPDARRALTADLLAATAAGVPC